jgi:hypothetical protein
MLILLRICYLKYAFRAGYVNIFRKGLKVLHIHLIYNCRIKDYN